MKNQALNTLNTVKKLPLAFHSDRFHHFLHHGGASVHLVHLAFCLFTLHGAESVVYALCVGFVVVEQLTGGEG